MEAELVGGKDWRSWQILRVIYEVYVQQSRIAGGVRSMGFLHGHEIPYVVGNLI